MSTFHEAYPPLLPFSLQTLSLAALRNRSREQHQGLFATERRHVLHTPRHTALNEVNFISYKYTHVNTKLYTCIVSTTMANPSNERVVVTEKDVEEQRLSFDERSNADSDQELEYDPQPALQREIWGWYAYSWAVSLHFKFSN